MKSWNHSGAPSYLPPMWNTWSLEGAEWCPSGELLSEHATERPPKKQLVFLPPLRSVLSSCMKQIWIITVRLCLPQTDPHHCWIWNHLPSDKWVSDTWCINTLVVWSLSHLFSQLFLRHVFLACFSSGELPIWKRQTLPRWPSYFTTWLWRFVQHSVVFTDSPSGTGSSFYMQFQIIEVKSVWSRLTSIMICFTSFKPIIH